MAVAYCWRTGVIGIGQRAPRGSLKLISGPARPLRAIVEVVARHAYDGKTLLVPGIPEAEGDTQTVDAALAFKEQIARRLAAQTAPAKGGLTL